MYQSEDDLILAVVAMMDAIANDNAEKQATSTSEDEDEDVIAPEEIEAVLNLIQQNDLDGLRRCLDDHTEDMRRKIVRHERARLCVHDAFDHCSRDLLEYLLAECGVDVDAMNSDGLTVLYRAVMASDKDDVELFLRHRASVHEADASLASRSCVHGPLVHVAIGAEDREILELLLQAGANPEAYDDITGRSSLHVAAVLDKADMVSCLVDHGADVLVADRLGHTPLYHAARVYRENSAVADFFLRSWTPAMCPSLEDFAVVFGGNVGCTLAQSVMEGLDGESKARLFEFVGIASVFLGDSGHAADMWVSAASLRQQNDNQAWDLLDRDVSLSSELGVVEGRSPQDFTVSFADMFIQAALRADRLAPKSYLAVNTLCAAMVLDSPSRHRAEMNILLLHRAMRLTSACKNRIDCEWTIYDTFLAASWNNLAIIEKMSVYHALLPLLDFGVESLIADRQAEGDFERHRSRHDVIADDKCSLCQHCAHRLCFLVKVMHLLLRFEDGASELQRKAFSDNVERLIQHDPRIRHWTMLHWGYGFLTPTDFTPDVIKLLVRCSHRINSRCQQAQYPLHLHPDYQGVTPLHMCAQDLPEAWLTEEGVLRCFLEHGAKLDLPNARGVRVADILKSRKIHMSSLVSSNGRQ